jgi:hypothetical protein
MRARCARFFEVDFIPRDHVLTPTEVLVVLTFFIDVCSVDKFDAISLVPSFKTQHLHSQTAFSFPIFLLSYPVFRNARHLASILLLLLALARLHSLSALFLNLGLQ